MKKYAKLCFEDDTFVEKAKEICKENVSNHITHAKSLKLNWGENDIHALAREMQVEGDIYDNYLEQISGGIVTRAGHFYDNTATSKLLSQIIHGF